MGKHQGFMTSAQRRAQTGKVALRDRTSPFYQKTLPKIVMDDEEEDQLLHIKKDIGIYLDDERPCPDGWTLARTPKAFFALLEREDDFLNRITHLSLDWYLGSNEVDGVTVAEQLGYMFFENPQFLPNLKAIGCHSSDRDQAARMARILSGVLEEEEIGRSAIRLRISTPPF